MKLLFSLAVITEKNQKVEDLIKPYIRKNYNDDLESCIKKQKNYISGVLFGSFDDDMYDGRLLLIKNKDGKNCLAHRAKIKEVEWQKMVEKENKQLKEEGVNLEENRVDLEKSFGFTHSIITPDGKWHGMMPLDLITIGFTEKEPCKEYIKNYYTKYIKPFEETGSITILTCNI